MGLYDSKPAAFYKYMYILAFLKSESDFDIFWQTKDEVAAYSSELCYHVLFFQFVE